MFRRMVSNICRYLVNSTQQFVTALALCMCQCWQVGRTDNIVCNLYMQFRAESEIANIVWCIYFLGLYFDKFGAVREVISAIVLR